jgi:PAS domain S-box-containing protein
MQGKPCYEELEQRVIELEDERAERLRAEKELIESEERFRSFIENLGDAAYEADAEGNITYANKICEKITGLPLSEILGKNFLPLFTQQSRDTAVRVFRQTLKGGSPKYELTFINGRTFHFKNKPLRGKDHKIVGVFGIARDITDQKMVEERLLEAHLRLEHKVGERTAELSDVNRELEIKGQKLQEVNTALKVLLRKKDEDRMDMEEKIIVNVKELVLPYLQKLKQSGLDKRQGAFADILEYNLNSITSTFSRSLSSRFLKLTPTEIRVANLVKKGTPTKEIARVMGLSKRTVDGYRSSIRGKLGIINKKANLRTYLLSVR